MSKEAERLAKSVLSRASAIKDRASESLSKAVHTHLDGRVNLESWTSSLGSKFPTANSKDSSTLDLVCAACRAGPFSYDGFRKAVAEGHYSDTSGYAYTRIWREISESVDKENCGWCRMVKRTRDGLPTDKFPYDKDRVEVRLQIQASTIGNRFGILLDGNKAAEYVIYANKGDGAVKEIGEEQRHFPKEPYVDYQKALECVEECSHHEHCSPPEKTHLPTRVIDCSDPSKPRLFDTGRKIVDHYCTLSYAWGGDQPAKTTTANIHTYINEGINVPLPQTIADAIAVTNKLGLKYLWVDALCIIQDSDDDKIKELGIMGQIYRHAYLTVSVLSAYRADEGFLHDERPPDVLPYYLAGQPQNPGRMLCEYIIPRKTPGAGKYETVPSHTPLDQRGWCFQESALSARRLIFQPPNVMYKCRSFYELEISRPGPLNRRFQRTEKASPANDHILFPIEGRANNVTPSDEDLRERWRRTLLDYSERKITVASDKFVALASIVEVFQSVMKDQYIAGLWKNNLLHDLHWKVWPPMGPDEGPRPRPEGYRAPTWSWASTDGRLDLPYSLSPPSSAVSYQAEILSWDVTPKARELPLGELVDGKLIMRAKIRPLMRDGSKCTFAEQKGKEWGSNAVKQFSSWDWTPPLGNCLEPVGFSVDGMSEEQKEKRVGGIRFDSVEGTEKDRAIDFYVLVLRAGRAYRAQGDWVNGLLVVRVEGKEDHYRRVGFLDLQYDFAWPDWFDSTPLKTLTLV